MDHGASLMSFLFVILVAYASFLPPFTAEARTKLVHQDNTHPHAKGHHQVDSPQRPTPKTPPPPSPPPSPPIIHDDYFPPPPPPLHPPPPIHPPALIVSPAPVPSSAPPLSSSPYYNGVAPVPSAAPPQSSSSPSPSPSLPPQSDNDYNSPPPFVLGVTPIGYWPPNGSWKCGEGPCWGSEYCDYPCNYCGANSTCIVEEDYDYKYFPDP